MCQRHAPSSHMQPNPPHVSTALWQTFSIKGKREIDCSLCPYPFLGTGTDCVWRVGLVDFIAHDAKPSPARLPLPLPRPPHLPRMPAYRLRCTQDCVTTASFEARLDAITNEFRSMADANKAAFQQGDQDAAAADAAKITSLEAKNKELQALIDAMQADLDSTTTTTTTTSSTSTATTVTTSTITSSTITSSTVTTVTTTAKPPPETALTNYARGTGGGGSKILPGKQGYKIVIDEIAICGVGGDNVGDNNPSGPSTWMLSAPSSENTFSVTGNGGTPGTIFLGGTPPFDRGSPRCSGASCGKGFAHKDINGQWVYASGADVTLTNTLLTDNDGEYCYGKTPDGKAMVDDHGLGHGTGRAWVMYHYERA